MLKNQFKIYFQIIIVDLDNLPEKIHTLQEITAFNRKFT